MSRGRTYSMGRCRRRAIGLAAAVLPAAAVLLACCRHHSGFSSVATFLCGSSAASAALRRSAVLRPAERSVDARKSQLLSLAAEGEGEAAEAADKDEEGGGQKEGVRVGVLTLPGVEHKLKELLEEKHNVTSDMFFQTEVPGALQLPIAAKFLAMSQTVDVIIAASGPVEAAVRTELLRAYQTVALTTNVPIVPMEDAAAAADAAAGAVAIGGIRQQALMGGGRKKEGNFFGIGKNTTNEEGSGKKKSKIYF